MKNTSTKENQLTAEEQDLINLWQEHTDSEFVHHNADMALSTMTANPHLMHIPVLTGGMGREQIHQFYSQYFIPNMPPDVEIELLSRTVGQDRIVDEFIFKFTHSVYMPWMLPGVEPTFKRVEIPFVGIIHFQNGKIESEHLYWDQAGVLVQIGLLDKNKFPVTGKESAERLRNPKLPANNLMTKYEN